MAMNPAIMAQAVLDIQQFTAGLATIVQQTAAATGAIAGSLQRIEMAATSAFGGAAAQSKKAAAGVGADWTVLSDTEKRLLSVQTAFNGLFRAATQLSSVGQTLMIFGGAITGVGVAAMTAAQDFDYWSTRVQAANEVANSFTGSAEQIKVSLQDIKNAGEAVSINVGAFDPSQVEQALYEWTTATGIAINNTDQLNAAMGTVEHILQAAAVSGIDLSTSIKGVAQVLAEFGLGVEYADQATNVLLNTASISNAEFADMIEAFKMIGPGAHAMGMTLEETAAAMDIMSNAGQKGTAAGRELQQVLASLNDPSKKAQGALSDLLEATDPLGRSWQQILFPAGQFIGLMDQINTDGSTTAGAVTLITNAVAGMTQAQGNMLLKQLESQNGYRGLAALVEGDLAQKAKEKDLTEQLTKAQADQNAGVEGAAQKVQDLQKQLDQLHTQMQGGLIKDLSDATKQQDLFNQQWQDVSQSIKIQFGEAMNGLKAAFDDLGTIASASILPILRYLSQLALALDAWAKQNPQTAQTIVQIISVIGAAVAALGALGFALGQLLQLFTVFQSFGATFGEMVSIIADAMGVFGGLGIVLAGLLVGTVALAQQGGAAWQNFTTAVQQAVADVQAVLGILLGDLVKTVQSFASGDWQGAWNSIQDAVVTAIAYLALYVPQVVGDFLSSMWTGLNNTFGGLPEQMLVWGENMVLSLAQGISSGASFLLQEVEDLAATIGMFFKSFSPPKHGPLKDISVWGTNLMKSLGSGMSDGEPHLDKAASDMAQSAGEELSDRKIKDAKDDKDKQDGHKVRKYAYGGDINEPVVGVGQASGDTYMIGEQGPETVGGVGAADTSGVQSAAASSVQSASGALDSAKSSLDASASDLGQSVPDSLVQGLEAGTPDVVTAARSLMDQFMAQFSKDDFSSLNDITDTIKASLDTQLKDAQNQITGQYVGKTYSGPNAAAERTADKNAETDAKNSAADKVAGQLSAAQEVVASALADMTTQANQATQAFDLSGPLDAMQGKLKDLETQVQASFNPAPAEQLKSILGDTAQDVNDLIQASGNVDALTAVKNAAQSVSDGLQLAIQKSQNLAQSIRDGANAFNESESHLDELNHKLQEANNNLDIQKAQIQETIDGLTDQETPIKDANDGLDSQLQTYQNLNHVQDEIIANANLQKTQANEQLSLIKARYQAEADADAAAMRHLQEQIDGQKSLNDAVEAGIQSQIANEEASGGSAAQIENLKKQLSIINDQHSAQEKVLTAQKEQLTVQQDLSKDKRDAQEAADEAPYNAQVQAAQATIDAANAQKQTNQNSMDLLQQQKDVNNQNLAILDKKIQDNKDSQTALDRQSSANSLQMKINDQIKSQIEDQATLQDKKTKGLQDEKQANDDKIKVINDELTAAKDRLTIEQDIVKEHQKMIGDDVSRNNKSDSTGGSSSSSSDSGFPSGSGGPLGSTPGSGANPADISGQAAGDAQKIKDQIDQMMKGWTDMSDQLKQKKADLDAQWQNLIDGFKTNLKTFTDSLTNSPTATAVEDMLGKVGRAFDLWIPIIAGDLKSGDLKGAVDDFHNLFDTVLMGIFGQTESELGTKITEIGETLKKDIPIAFKAAGDAIGPALDGAFHDLSIRVLGYFNGLRFYDIVHDALKIPANLGDWIQEGLTSGIGAGIQMAKYDIGSALNKMGQDLFGSRASGMFDQMGRVAEQFSDGFGSLADAMKTILPPLAALFGDVLGPAIAALGVTFKQVAELIDQHKDKLTEAFNEIGPVLQIIATVLGFLVGGIIVGFVEGIINLIEGIGSLIKGFRELWEGLTQWKLDVVLQGLKDIFGGLGQAILGLLETGFVGPFGFFGDLGERLMGIAMKALDGFGGKLIEFLISTILKVPDAAGAIGGGLRDIVAGGVKFLLDVLPDIFGVLKDLGKDFLDAVTGPLKGPAGDLGKVLADAFKDLGSILGDPFKPLVQSFTDFLGTVAGWGGELKTKLGDLVTSILGFNPADAIGQFLSGLGTAAEQALKDLFSGMGNKAAQPFEDFFGNLAKTASEKIQGLFNGAGDLLGGSLQYLFDAVADKAPGFLQEPIRSIGDFFAKGIEGYFATIGDILSGNISGAIGRVGDAVSGLIHGVFDGLGSLFGSMANEALTGVGEALADLLRGAATFATKTLPDSLHKIFSDLFTNLFSMGGDLAQDTGTALGRFFDPAGKVASDLGDAFGTLFKVGGDLAGKVASAVGGMFGDAFSRLGTAGNDIKSVIQNNLGKSLEDALGSIKPPEQLSFLDDMFQLKGLKDKDLTQLPMFKDWPQEAEQAITQTSTAVQRALDGLGSLVSGAFDALRTRVTQTISNLWTDIVLFFTEKPAEIIGAIGVFIQGVVTVFQNLYDVLVGHSIIPDLINAIIDWIGKLPGEVLDTIKTWVGDVTTWFGTLKDNMVTAVTGLVAPVTKIASDMMTGFLNGLKSFWTGTLQPWVNTFFQDGGTLLGEITKLNPLALLQHVGEDLLNGLATGVSNIWDTVVKPWFTTLFGGGGGDISFLNVITLLNPGVLLVRIGGQLLSGLLDGLKGWWDGTSQGAPGGGLKGWFTTLFGGIDTEGSILNLISMSVKLVANDLQTVGSDLFSRITDGVQSGWTSLTTWVQKTLFSADATTDNGLLKILNGGLTGIIQGLKDLGGGIINDIRGGIEDAWHGLTDKVTELLNGLPQFVKNLLGIKSPSTVFAEIGMNIVQGLIKGIESKFGDVTSSMGKLGSLVNQNMPGPQLSGNVSDWLNQAIAITGVSPDWLQGLLTLVAGESGGDPTIQNPNAVIVNGVNYGHATGLMQTLPGTFSQYALPGHGDITNPVDNAIAGIRYIAATYGSVYDIPGLGQANYGGRGGYASGGYIMEPIFGVGARTGNPYSFGEEGIEAVLNRTQLDNIRQVLNTVVRTANGLYGLQSSATNMAGSAAQSAARGQAVVIHEGDVVIQAGLVLDPEGVKKIAGMLAVPTAKLNQRRNRTPAYT